MKPSSSLWKGGRVIPNWCSNTFVVYGSRSELALLRDYLVKHIDSDKQKADDAVKYNKEMSESDRSAFDEDKVRAEYGSGDPWIVHVFIDLYNYEDLDGFSKDGMNIRGYITGVDDSAVNDTSNPTLTINSESAWGPWNEFFNKMLEDHFPDLQFVYEAIEPGNGVYINSDTDHKFLTDEFRIWDGEMEDYYSSFDDLKSAVKSRSGFALDDVNTYEDLTKFITDYNEMLCKYDNEDNQIYVDEFSSE